jgi:phenylacetate-CoA ligase
MFIAEFSKRLPYPIKQSLKYIYGFAPPSIRYGKMFWETFNFLQESQWWSREKLEEYQMQQLSKLLHHAYKNVSYYRCVFDERGLKPKDIQDFNDLRKLPYLAKNDFKKHFRELLAANTSLKNLPMSHTSGTSGKPLQFYESRFTSQKELAFICHQWTRVGYKPGEPRIELRGAINRKNPVYYDPISKILRLSPIIEHKETVRHYVDKMNLFGGKFLHGYPSAIASFAYTIKKYGFAVPFRLKAVLFASEAVYEWERELVQEVFDCRVFSHYGMAEKVVLASECEHSNYYHCLPQYGITEINPETYEIIGTGFINHVNPFIRYRTTDVASTSTSSKCENCERNYYPLFMKVEGRLEDFIVTPEGAMISPAVITHPFKDIKTIKDVQLVQESPDHIILRAVPWKGSESKMLKAELDRLCCDLRQIIGLVMQIKVQVLEEIERPKSGKFKWIQSKVSKDLLHKGLKDV